MYYKVIFDGSVIDALDGLQYVVQNKSNHGVIGTDDELEAMGVLSSDCEEIWHVNTMQEFYDGDYKTVSLIQIEEDEYNELRAELDEGKEVEYDVPTAEEPKPAVKTALMLRVEELSEQLEFLTECLLEMSEVVYE